jgi:hypothetical protein
VDQANNDAKREIVKDILAFSNTRDGGVILIGVNDKSGALEGLSEEQYATFDQTKFYDFVQKYTDPRHTANVHRIAIDEKRVVVIDVPEFADVPILCARDANSSVNPSKLIRRRAALYKRTEKATSEVIEDGDAMRELLNRGLLRRQDDLSGRRGPFHRPGIRIKGRRLIWADPLAQLQGDYRIEVTGFEIRETVGVSDLRADPETIARRIIRRTMNCSIGMIRTRRCSRAGKKSYCNVNSEFLEKDKESA